MSEMTNDALISVYPPVLDKDKLFNALGLATAEVLGQAFIDVDKTGIYTRINQLDEGILDILAKDFNVSWYNYDYPLAIKRRVIAAAFSVHRNNGTKGALETALQAVYPNARVLEWFEYGGDPFYFRIEVNDSAASYNSVLTMIQLYKNERSHLQDIVLTAVECDVDIYAGAANSETSISAVCQMS